MKRLETRAGILREPTVILLPMTIIPSSFVRFKIRWLLPPPYAVLHKRSTALSRRRHDSRCHPGPGIHDQDNASGLLGREAGHCTVSLLRASCRAACTAISAGAICNGSVASFVNTTRTLHMPVVLTAPTATLVRAQTQPLNSYRGIRQT